MEKMPAASPFTKTELLPIEDGYVREGSLMGLALPNGEILINYDRNTKNSIMTDIARVLKAEVVVVKGTWTFTPARQNHMKLSHRVVCSCGDYNCASLDSLDINKKPG